MLFEELGFSYFGPVDGHDVDRLIEVLENIKTLKGPVMLHIVTKKGKGYDLAEKDPITWHGPGKFDVKTGALLKSTAPAAARLSESVRQALVKLAKEDPTHRLHHRRDARRHRHGYFPQGNSVALL